MLSFLAVASLFLIVSCGKKSADETMDGHNHAEGHSGMNMDADHHEGSGTDTAGITQTTCPVMGNPINPDIFVEYKGKKIYFCCNACPPKFKEDPEKYLAKMKAETPDEAHPEK